ncbi:hypothetical protein [Pseudoalteromonas piscicida]|nr:hypothetical protein [Pseudoalteromonas piscicida]
MSITPLSHPTNAETAIPFRQGKISYSFVPMGNFSLVDFRFTFSNCSTIKAKGLLVVEPHTALKKSQKSINRENLADDNKICKVKVTIKGAERAFYCL